MSERFPGVYASTGVFVCFEGGEGAGKSTQSKMLRERLEAAGHVVLLTHEPGATPVGAEVRRIVLDPSTGELADRTEALLYAADKAEHIHAVVRPRSSGARSWSPTATSTRRSPTRAPAARSTPPSWSGSPAGPPRTCVPT